MLPETRSRAAATSSPTRFSEHARALLSNRRFIGYALCLALGTAPFFTFLGGGPYVLVTMMGKSSVEYGIWFGFSSIGFMAGNFSAARWTMRYGIDRMIWWGVVVTIAGTGLPALLCVLDPDIGQTAVFLPMTVISYGNGLLLPTAIAGAVSIRPEVAGTASGVAGFIQWGLGAIAVQIVSHLITGAASPLPMLVAMLAWGLATATAFLLLVRRSLPLSP